MKRFILLLVMIVAICGSAEAQKGMSGIGLNAALVNELGIGVGVKYQYNVTNYVRIEPSFSFYNKDRLRNTSLEMAGLLNTNIFFCSPRAFRPYIIAGIGYWKESQNHMGLTPGLGIDYRVTHDFSIQVEGGALLGINAEKSNYVRLNLGACYNF